MNFPLGCPLPTALTSVTAQTCPFKFDQLVRLGLQQRVSASTFATTTDLKTLANWQALMSATDATKIVMTPLFSGMVIPQSEPLTTGGNDNSTIAGVENYHGEGKVTATGIFTNLQPSIKLELMALTQFSLPGATGLSGLTMYAINKDGKIYYWEVSGDIFGVRCSNFRIGSRGSEGLNSDDKNGFGFTLEPNWDNYIAVVEPTFDPLTEL